MKHIYTKAALCAALALSVTTTVAKVPESELARLDNDLTPMGSERAGNAAVAIAPAPAPMARNRRRRAGVMLLSSPVLVIASLQWTIL